MQSRPAPICSYRSPFGFQGLYQHYQFFSLNPGNFGMLIINPFRLVEYLEIMKHFYTIKINLY